MVVTLAIIKCEPENWPETMLCSCYVAISKQSSRKLFNSESQETSILLRFQIVP